MMAAMTRVLIFSAILGACYALTEKNQFATTTEVSMGYSTEDRLLENIIRAENSSQLVPDDNSDKERKTDKKPRTVLHRDSSPDARDNCCNVRYSSNGSARPDHNYNRIPLETVRYPSQYNERPIDRYGWQTRLSGPTGNGGRPGGGGIGSGNGIYGAASQSGDRYGPRPAYASETANQRPSTSGYGSGSSGSYGASGYGGYGRPTGYGGGYGITGTLADGDEFGHGETVYPEGGLPQLTPGNINTQKAVALKALAGVALIGAAAALASNPILLPIGIVAGRRKRSENFDEEGQTDVQTDYIMNMLRANLAKIQRHSSTNRLIVSPRCVARLACEIQKDYLRNIEEDVEVLNTQKQYFINLLQKNVLNTTVVSANVKNLIKLATDIATENESCDVFSCSYINKRKIK